MKSGQYRNLDTRWLEIQQFLGSFPRFTFSRKSGSWHFQGILTEHPKKIIVKTRESNLISFFALISSAALMWVFPINRRIGYRDVYQTKFTFQMICLQTFLSKEKTLADQCRLIIAIFNIRSLLLKRLTTACRFWNLQKGNETYYLL